MTTAARLAMPYIDLERVGTRGVPATIVQASVRTLEELDTVFRHRRTKGMETVIEFWTDPPIKMIAPQPLTRFETLVDSIQIMGPSESPSAMFVGRIRQYQSLLFGGIMFFAYLELNEESVLWTGITFIRTTSLETLLASAHRAKANA